MATPAYLKSLPSIRPRCTSVFSLAEHGKLQYWDIDLSKQDEIVQFTLSLIQRDFGNDFHKIPPHGRWRHFNPLNKDRVGELLNQWDDAQTPPLEVARRLVDLFVVSVLLDAGAGPTWAYRESPESEPISRSEGLAVASLDMFKAGLFSSDASNPFQVDSKGLQKLTTAQISEAMQVSPTNEMTGIHGRAELLIRLGTVLESHTQYFPASPIARPGNMLDYLLEHPKAQQIPSPSALPISLPIDALWEVIVEGLGGVWPSSRTQLEGTSLGDVWPCEALKAQGNGETEALVPFHKLSQWLCYSLIEVMKTILNWEFTGLEDMTGLPEYRNGGLLIDFGLLNLRIPAVCSSLSLDNLESYKTPLDLPPLPAHHPAMIEMRAVTVIMLDRIKDGINAKIGQELSLPQVLESATWKGGREIAKQKREGGGPPINILSDGTIF